MRKGIYLDNVPLSEAIRTWHEKIKAEMSCPLKSEIVPAGQSLGRITGEAVFAKMSSPFYHASAMDGYAVRFTDTSELLKDRRKGFISGNRLFM